MGDNPEEFLCCFWLDRELSDESVGEESASAVPEALGSERVDGTNIMESESMVSTPFLGCDEAIGYGRSVLVQGAKEVTTEVYNSTFSTW